MSGLITLAHLWRSFGVENRLEGHWCGSSISDVRRWPVEPRWFGEEERSEQIPATSSGKRDKTW